MLKIMLVTIATAILGAICWLIAAWLYMRRSTLADRRRRHEEPFVQELPMPKSDGGRAVRAPERKFDAGNERDGNKVVPMQRMA